MNHTIGGFLFTTFVVNASTHVEAVITLSSGCARMLSPRATRSTVRRESPSMIRAWLRSDLRQSVQCFVQSNQIRRTGFDAIGDGQRNLHLHP